MKNNKKILIIAIFIFILMLIPIPTQIKNGDKEYNALLYKYTRIHRPSEQSSTGYEDGWELKILGIYVGGKVDTHIETKNSFTAKVLENDENHDLVVEVIEDSKYFKKGEKVKIKVENYQGINTYYMEGWILEIIFNGNIEESDPPQISSSSISVLDYSILSFVVVNKTISSKGATFILKNYTDEEYSYGPVYTIEKFENQTWKELDTLTNPLTWNSIVYSLKAHEEKEFIIDWYLGYGELKNGTYRLVKNDLRKANSPESRAYSVYAKFDIK